MENTTETVNNNESSLPYEFVRQLRAVKRTFIDEISPSFKRHGHFVGKGERRRQKHGKAISVNRRTLHIEFSPLAMTLGHGLVVSTARTETRQHEVVGYPASRYIMPAAQPNQLVSVFVLAVIKDGTTERYVMQKVEHKSAPGFPGGGIEDGESVLEAAKREFFEETRGKDGKAGVDIAKYAPVSIGKFTLNRAQNNEQGAVILVELPKSEMKNIVAGGGDEEGENVEEVGFLTFGEVQENLPHLLPNAQLIWNLYIDYLVS